MSLAAKAFSAFYKSSGKRSLLSLNFKKLSKSVRLNYFQHGLSHLISSHQESKFFSALEQFWCFLVTHVCIGPMITLNIVSTRNQKGCKNFMIFGQNSSSHLFFHILLSALIFSSIESARKTLLRTWFS